MLFLLYLMPHTAEYCRPICLVTRLTRGRHAYGASHSESLLPKQLTALKFCTSPHIGYDWVCQLEHLRELDMSLREFVEFWHSPSSWSLEKVKLRTKSLLLTAEYSLFISFLRVQSFSRAFVCDENPARQGKGNEYSPLNRSSESQRVASLI